MADLPAIQPFQVQQLDLPNALATHYKLQQMQQQQASQNALMQAGPDLVSTDPNARKRGVAAIAAVDPAQAFEWQSKYAQLDEGQRKHAQELTGILGGVANYLKTLPPEQRAQALAAQAPRLVASGIPVEQIQNFDPSDQNLDGIVAQATDLKTQISNMQFDRKFKAGRSDHADTQSYRASSLAIQRQNANTSAMNAARSLTPTVEADPAAADPNSRAITAQTGLSVPAFLVLTGQSSKLPRDKLTRNTAFKEAQDFANNKGVDISTLSSQYEAYNKTLESNIQRNNQTKVMEDELVGTIDNLRPVADAAAMGTLRVENVAKLFAGKEFNDPVVAQYSFHLQQLHTELAAYSAATQGRTGNNITDGDRHEASRVIMNGLSSKSADGLQKAVGDATNKMDAVMQRNIYLSNKAVWGLFGVGEHYDRVNGGAPSGRAAVSSTGQPTQPSPGGWSIKLKGE